jgi:hypothetical protein
MAAVRLARDPDISRPSPRLTAVVSESANLARMILDRVDLQEGGSFGPNEIGGDSANRGEQGGPTTDNPPTPGHTLLDPFSPLHHQWTA